MANPCSVREVVGDPQTVTLVVDVSASISGSAFNDMTAGLKALVAQYAALGLPITVTLIPFADSVGASETFSFSAATDAGYLDLENAMENLGQGYGGVGALGTTNDHALNAERGARSEERRV